MTFYLSSALSICISMVLLTSTAAASTKTRNANGIVGIWQTYDDKTKRKKAQVQITYNKKTQSYIGRIIKITPVKGYKPKTHCQKCPPPFTNQKINGMTVFWNLKAQKNKLGNFNGQYDGGYVLDPLSGKMYRFKTSISRNKRILKGRAYVGIAPMGRSQTWTRVDTLSTK